LPLVIKPLECVTIFEELVLIYPSTMHLPSKLAFIFSSIVSSLMVSKPLESRGGTGQIN
jgi:hypothetical protein